MSTRNSWRQDFGFVRKLCAAKSSALQSPNARKAFASLAALGGTPAAKTMAVWYSMAVWHAVAVPPWLQKPNGPNTGASWCCSSLSVRKRRRSHSACDTTPSGDLILVVTAWQLFIVAISLSQEIILLALDTPNHVKWYCFVRSSEFFRPSRTMELCSRLHSGCSICSDSGMMLHSW